MAVSLLGLPTGVDIRADVWHGVLQCLLDDPKTILSLAQTCTGLHDLADHEQVWQSVAVACWRQLAAVGRTGYSTYKGLVLDDNRSNAAMALAFSSTACTYRFQRPLAFYECRLLQLQWWRPANSLRLYFDARGEFDLRLPLSSSIAVIRVKNGQADETEACSSSIRAAAAAAGATAGGAVCSGSFDLDAMGTRLLVHAPDACHTFVQKPGHYKGVLIWHPSKTTELLRTLLLCPPPETTGVPAQQHSPEQAGRRSDAWEEWAEWELEHESEEEEEEEGCLAASTSSSSSGNHHDREPGSVSALLRSCFQHWCSPGANSNSGSSSMHHGSDSTCAGGCSSGSSGNCQQRADSPAPRHALVFCYANDLKWYHTMRTPDYSITPLAVSVPQAATAESSSSRCGKVPARACPSPQGRPYQQRGQVTKHLQRRTHEAPQLSKKEEGQLVAAWKQLPGAVMQQCGALDQQLQGEGQAQEKLRWSALPAAVKARGDDWWV